MFKKLFNKNKDNDKQYELNDSFRINCETVEQVYEMLVDYISEGICNGKFGDSLNKEELKLALVVTKEYFENSGFQEYNKSK